MRALKIREGEVVIEAFPGPGQLTRSLLYGGNDISASDGEGAESGKGEKRFPEPKLVVSVEPSPDLLVTGLGMRPEDRPKSIPARFESEDYSVYESQVVKTDEPRLLVSPSTPYRWPTLPQMLSHELVTPHLPVYGTDITASTETTTPDSELGTTRRPWRAPVPHITVVSQMPDSVAGDQLVSQWVGSCVGTKEDQKSWIWRWGRVRLALLVSKTQYDVRPVSFHIGAIHIPVRGEAVEADTVQRLMAGPREKIFCKLSVMTRALFHITPLPPYHHVYNVDKSSRRTESSAIIPRTGSGAISKSKINNSIQPPPDPHQPTTTYPDDFFPIPIGYATHTDIALPRPFLLGVLLEPRLDSPVNMENKDEWDYVLRKCFVTEAQTIRSSLKNLAFGAEILMDRISSEDPNSRYAGRPVSPDRVVRDLEVEEWTRVVDCFDKWAFKPSVSLIHDFRSDSWGVIADDLTESSTRYQTGC